MNFVPSPEPKIAESTQKALNRLDRLRQDMRLSIGELNSLLVNVLGSNAPGDYRLMNSSQTMHVIRYMVRSGAKILLEKQEKQKERGRRMTLLIFCYIFCALTILSTITDKAIDKIAKILKWKGQDNDDNNDSSRQNQSNRRTPNLYTIHDRPHRRRSYSTYNRKSSGRIRKRYS